MKNEELEKIFKENFEKRFKIMQKKNKDYAGEDGLSNFKRVGLAFKISPPESCLFHICHKVERLINLIRGNKYPVNETIEDTILDLQNYLDLLSAILKENGGIK